MKWAVSYITITLQYYLFKITGALWSHQLAILMWNFRPIGNEEKYTTLWIFETSFNCLSWEHSTLWWHQGNVTRNYLRFKSTERGNSIVSSCCVCASCIGSLMYPALFSSSTCVLKLASPLYCSVASHVRSYGLPSQPLPWLLTYN